MRQTSWKKEVQEQEEQAQEEQGEGEEKEGNPSTEGGFMGKKTRRSQAISCYRKAHALFPYSFSSHRKLDLTALNFLP